MKPIVAIIGRPNVGKSTLFNRITRKRDALVDDFPGVTRDRHYSEAEWDNHAFVLVDTGGFTDDDYFADAIQFQIKEAVKEADFIIAVLDGKNGLSPFDRDLLELMHGYNRKVFYAVNKIDNPQKEEELLADFYALGIGEFFPVAAEHNYGVHDLLDALVNAFDEQGFGQSKKEKTADRLARTHIAIVGRPNVGKSSLLNRILGEERAVVSDIPGTTVDSVDSLCKVHGKEYVLIDTAGIRRKGKVYKKLEKFSVLKSLQSLARCDVALIVIDAEEGVTDQDVNIAGYAFDRGCGVIFVLNKWDKVEKDNKTMRQYTDDLRYKAKFLGFAPIVTVSALTGQRVPKIFPLVDEIYGQYTTRIGTGEVNRIIEQATEATPPAMYNGRRIKFYYATQADVKPPTFVAFVNYPEAVHFSYKRFLINQIRETTGLDKTPILMHMRLRKNKVREEAAARDEGKRKSRGGQKSAPKKAGPNKPKKKAR